MVRIVKEQRVREVGLHGPKSIFIETDSNPFSTEDYIPLDLFL